MYEFSKETSERDNLDEQKLNKIKVNVIRVERDNIIKKDPNDTIVENLRRYIERVVDGKC